jgi:translation elongation factor EF-1alpha
VPISVWNGENMMDPIANMPWLRDRTHKYGNTRRATLLETTYSILTQTCLATKSLYLHLQDIYKISSIVIVPVDRVENDFYQIFFQNHKKKIKSFEMYHKSLSEAIPGDVFNVKNMSVKMVILTSLMVTKPKRPLSHTSWFLA